MSGDFQESRLCYSLLPKWSDRTPFESVPSIRFESVSRYSWANVFSACISMKASRADRRRHRSCAIKRPCWFLPWLVSSEVIDSSVRWTHSTDLPPQRDGVASAWFCYNLHHDNCYHVYMTVGASPSTGFLQRAERDTYL